MDGEGWLIEHVVEIISLIVAIIGFGFTVRYLYRISIKQNMSLENSKNNILVQMGNNTGPVEINQLKEQSADETFILSDKPSVLDKTLEAKELISRIEYQLDEEKPVSPITEMCLRLANKLNMKNDITWLSSEVNGFYQQSTGGLESRKIDDDRFKEYRRVKAKLYLQVSSRPSPEEFQINMFISQPIREIEFWGNQFGGSQPIIMRTAPLKVMVDTLHISPDEQIPYLVESADIKKISIGLRLELNKFLERARKQLK